MYFACIGVIWIVHFRTAYRAKYRLLSDGSFPIASFCFLRAESSLPFHASWLSIFPSSIIVLSLPTELYHKTLLDTKGISIEKSAPWKRMAFKSMPLIAPIKS
jgi:hypothetical protein